MVRFGGDCTCQARKLIRNGTVASRGSLANQLTERTLLNLSVN